MAVNDPRQYQRDWRGISGVATDVPQAVPPPRDWSTSEGDRNRHSFRPSIFSRLFQRAVCNDDGTPIAEKTDVLLVEILAELRALRAELAERGRS